MVPNVKWLKKVGFLAVVLTKQLHKKSEPRSNIINEVELGDRPDGHKVHSTELDSVRVS